MTPHRQRALAALDCLLGRLGDRTQARAFVEAWVPEQGSVQSSTAEDRAVAIAEEIDALVCARVDKWDVDMRAEAQSRLVEVIQRALEDRA